MEELNCRFVRASLWDYSAGALAEPVSMSVSSHLGSCRECDLRRLEIGSLRTGLRQLPVKHAPVILETRLRVLASREGSRLRARRDFAAWCRDKASTAKLFIDHLLKPFAVPAAGGILASFFCFVLIVGNLHVRADWDHDMPLGLTTEASFDETSPFCGHDQNVLVQVTVDPTGHVSDYSLPQLVNSREQMQEIGNFIMYSTFVPAMRFGRPISSKRLVYINHIDVKG